MLRIACLSQLRTGLRLLALATVFAGLTGCVAMKPAWSPTHSDEDVVRNHFAVPPGNDVVGRLAVVRLEEGDTLPDVARHFGLGLGAVAAANPGVDVWVPEAGARVTLPMSFILPDAPRKGIVINLATMRLFQFREEGGSLRVSTYPVGVGTSEKPTPTGAMYVARKAARPTWHVPASIAKAHREKGDILPAQVPPGPDNPLGEYALYLSRAGYLIHGTNKPASIGLKASNGCLRLYAENIERLYQDTLVNTPVLIVNQPYLIGQRDGVLYLEAHRPQEGPADKERERVHARLKTLEAKAARTLDWKKVQEVETEARGIPVPILALREGAAEVAQPLEIRHPGGLLGAPAVPELKMNAWYVAAGEVRDEREARRLAAMINHQGPPIPARVLAKSSSTGYRVLAGPFSDAGKAGDVVRRLKMDLDIDGVVVPPVVSAGL